MTFKQFFHYLSYLQYPLMMASLFFAFQPYFIGFDAIKNDPTIYLANTNSMLVFMGLGLSFSSLQDTTKTQNKLSRKILENPKKGKIFIVVVIMMIAFALGTGLIGYFSNDNKIINELSAGLIVLGLGMFGFLKTVN